MTAQKSGLPVVCPRCKMPVDGDATRVMGLCPVCWEKEGQLTDESISRADKVLWRLRKGPGG